MWQALVRLALQQPQLLGDHARAYAVLLAAQLALLAAAWQRRARLEAMALAAATVALLLAGVAVLLWAALPAGSLHAPWALLVTPLLPALLALLCLRGARRATLDDPLAPVRRQCLSDLAMLRRARAPGGADWLLVAWRLGRITLRAWRRRQPSAAAAAAARNGG